jgi:hypothetical protein
MGLAIVWLFIGTYEINSVVKVAKDMLEEIQDRSMYAIQSPSSETFVGHLSDSVYEYPLRLPPFLSSLPLFPLSFPSLSYS